MGSRNAGSTETLAGAGPDDAGAGGAGLATSAEAGEGDGWVDSTVLLAKLATGGAR